MKKNWDSSTFIKEENIEIEEHSFEEIESKVELMEQLNMADKRTLDQMDEETESPSPKKLKLDQPIITGPKKVMRVLLKKVSTPAGTPIPRLSRASKDSAKSFLKQVFCLWIFTVYSKEIWWLYVFVH